MKYPCWDGACFCVDGSERNVITWAVWSPDAAIRFFTVSIFKPMKIHSYGVRNWWQKCDFFFVQMFSQVPYFYGYLFPQKMSEKPPEFTKIFFFFCSYSLNFETTKITACDWDQS